MPFENKAVVVALKTEQILELINYFILGKKAHPLAGMTFTISNNVAKNIMIQGKPIENDKIYYVITSDYLSNGGDKMDFFKKGIATYDLDYKLRNILIDYFKETKIIPIINDIRISIEK
jgi:2',3'-cyclic-nucleotide 2'-phosphodiesterase (5'-nucleotidase family)